MLYELSVPVYPGMPRYDETIPDVDFFPRTRIENGDMNNTSSVKVFLHGGSHVDAPFHFDKDGTTIDQIPIERFLYQKALLIMVPKNKGERITREDLENSILLKDADLLLLYTGYSHYVENEKIYADDFPALDYTAAKYLRRECPKLQAVAIDTLSIEAADGAEKNYNVHHELLDEYNRRERSLLIYENMDFRQILDNHGFFQVYAFPLRFQGLDASPVTMVADIKEE